MKGKNALVTCYLVVMRVRYSVSQFTLEIPRKTLNYLRLLFQPFQPALNNLTTLRHSHVPDLKKFSHTRDTTTSKSTLRERLVSIQAEGVSMAEGLERLTCNPQDPSISPALNASWICSR